MKKRGQGISKRSLSCADPDQIKLLATLPCNVDEGITELKTLNLFDGPIRINPTGAVQLRELLRDVGLRSQERELTFAIEHDMALQLRRSCPPIRWLVRGLSYNSWGKCNPVDWIHGVARYLLFEVTTEWGHAPGRALLILLGLIVVMTPIYTIPIRFGHSSSGRSHGIFRIWPQERLVFETGEITAATQIRVERLQRNTFSALIWGLYFSVVSSFHIGWRDLNLGTWITRMQLSEYGLRAHGWVRCASGAQSLVCVYLVAVWALTYFGRPFQ